MKMLRVYFDIEQPDQQLLDKRDTAALAARVLDEICDNSDELDQAFGCLDRRQTDAVMRLLRQLKFTIVSDADELTPPQSPDEPYLFPEMNLAA